MLLRTYCILRILRTTSEAFSYYREARERRGADEGAAGVSSLHGGDEAAQENLPGRQSVKEVSHEKKYCAPFFYE